MVMVRVSVGVRVGLTGRVRVRVTGRVRVRLRVRRGAPHDQREVERREEAVRHHVRRARRPRSQPRGWLTHEEPLHEGSRLGVHVLRPEWRVTYDARLHACRVGVVERRLAVEQFIEQHA